MTNGLRDRCERLGLPVPVPPKQSGSVYLSDGALCLCFEVPPCVHPSITTITSTDAAASASVAATDTADTQPSVAEPAAAVALATTTLA